MVQTANVVQLKPRTLEAFAEYIREAEAAMQPSLKGNSAFLWSDSDHQRAQQVRHGKIVAQLWAGDGPVKLPNGLIHDWTGAAFIPKATVDQTLTLVQNYDNHKNIYQPEVIDSKLISQDGNDFKIFLRLLKKKIITVVLDTDHDVHYSEIAPGRWFCRSYTTRIVEVEDVGTEKEHTLAPDTGYGFLWRLYSYWKFDEKRDERRGVRCVGPRSLHRVPRHLAHPRHTVRLGMDHRTHHPQAAAGIADPHPGMHAQGAARCWLTAGPRLHRPLKNQLGMF